MKKFITGLLIGLLFTGMVASAAYPVFQYYQGGTGKGSYDHGDLIYFSSTSDKFVNISTSTDGYVLTLVSNIPAWAESAGGGAFTTTTADYWASQTNLSVFVNDSGFITTSDWATTSANYWLTTKDTGDLTEGTNLYYTNARVSTYLTGGTGITESSGTLSFDCSEVEGVGIDCSVEAITLDATGDWTGVLDGLDGSVYYMTTSTQMASDDFGDFSCDGTDAGCILDTDYLSLTAFYSTTTEEIVEGGTNYYYSTQRFATDLAGTTTDALTEGSTNKYFSTAQVDSHLSGGTAITYSAGTISVTADEITDTELFYNTGQHLTTTAAPTFNDLTVTYGLTSATGTITTLTATTGTFSGTLTSSGTLVITGNLDIPSSATLQVGTEGYIGIDTTSDTIQYQGSATRTIAYWHEKCITMSSTTVSGINKTNISIWYPYKAIEVFEQTCIGDANGTTTLNISDSSNNTDSINCGYTLVKDSSLSNNTWTADERMELDITAITGSQNYFTYCIRYLITAD